MSPGSTRMSVVIRPLMIVCALVALCAPFAFAGFVIYSLIHFVIKFW